MNLLALPLIAIVLGCQIFGKSGLKIASAAVGLNWLYCTIFVLTTKQYDPFIWFSVIDLITFFVVTIPPGRFPKALAVTYAVQIMMHWAHGLAGGGALPYLEALDAVMVLQLALLLIWIGHDTGGWTGLHRLVHRLRARFSADGKAAMRASKRDGEG